MFLLPTAHTGSAPPSFNFDIETMSLQDDLIFGKMISNSASKPSGLAMSDDETRMLMTLNEQDIIVPYKAVAGEPASAQMMTEFQFDLSVDLNDANTSAVWAKPDGTRMWFAGFNFETLVQRDLGRAWEPETTSNKQTYDFGAPFSRTIIIRDLEWHPDGTEFYILEGKPAGSAPTGYQHGMVHVYTVSIPWNINSTVTYQSSRSGRILGDAIKGVENYGIPGSFSIISKGWRALIIEQDLGPVENPGASAEAVLQQVVFDSPYDFSSYELEKSVVLDHAVWGGWCGIMHMNKDETRLYIGNAFVQAVRYYYNDASAVPNTTIPSKNPENLSFVNSDSATASASAVRDCFVNNDTSKFYVVSAGDDKIYQHSITFDGSGNMTLTDDSKSATVGSGNRVFTGADINSDGTVIYVADNSQKVVWQINLSTPYDLGTASDPTLSLDVSNHFQTLASLDITSDDSTLCILDRNRDKIVSFNIEDIDDVSKCTFDSEFHTGNCGDADGTRTGQEQEFLQMWACIAEDDETMLLSGRNTDKAHEFGFVTAGDVDSLRFNFTALDHSGNTKSSWGGCYSHDDNKVFVIDQDGTTYQYS